MNSHICHWLPSIRVSIDWWRKGCRENRNYNVNRNQRLLNHISDYGGIYGEIWFKYGKIWDHNHWKDSVIIDINQHAFFDFSDRIDRQPEAKKKKKDTHSGNKMTPWLRQRRHSRILRDAIYIHSSPANVLKSDSLVMLAIRWDHSPRNWHCRPSNLGTNPRGWSSRWCHIDVTINIMRDVPLRKKIILLNIWVIGECSFTCRKLRSFACSIVPGQKWTVLMGLYPAFQ